MEVTFQPVFVEGIHDGSNHPDKRKTHENDQRERDERLQRIMNPLSHYAVHGVGPDNKAWEAYLEEAGRKHKEYEESNGSVIGSLGSAILPARSVGGRKRPFASLGVSFAPIIEEGRQEDRQEDRQEEEIDQQQDMEHIAEGILENATDNIAQTPPNNKSTSSSSSSSSSALAKKKSKRSVSTPSTKEGISSSSSSNATAMPSLMGTFIENSNGGVHQEPSSSSSSSSSFRASLLSMTQEESS